MNRKFILLAFLAVAGVASGAEFGEVKIKNGIATMESSYGHHVWEDSRADTVESKDEGTFGRRDARYAHLLEDHAFIPAATPGKGLEPIQKPPLDLVFRK